jgi:formylglycine-generating enzyme required for sulfatase activity
LNYSGTDDHPTTAPVGAVSADVSLDGIYDLAGNISEWVAAGPWDRDPRKRTTRGGNWLFPPVSSMRRAVHQIDPGHRGRSTGFRCAADAR